MSEGKSETTDLNQAELNTLCVAVVFLRNMMKGENLPAELNVAEFDVSLSALQGKLADMIAEAF